MKRRAWAIAAVSCVLIAIGLSWIIGARIETRFRAIEAASATDSERWQLRIAEYDRGWFSSTLRSQVLLPRVTGPEFVAEVRHEIMHGPWTLLGLPRHLGQFNPGLSRMDSRIALSVDAAAMLQPDVTELSVWITSLLGFDGRTRHDFDIPAITFPSGEHGVRIERTVGSVSAAAGKQHPFPLNLKLRLSTLYGNAGLEAMVSLRDDEPAPVRPSGPVVLSLPAKLALSGQISADVGFARTLVQRHLEHRLQSENTQASPAVVGALTQRKLDGYIRLGLLSKTGSGYHASFRIDGTHLMLNGKRLPWQIERTH